MEKRNKKRILIIALCTIIALFFLVGGIFTIVSNKRNSLADDFAAKKELIDSHNSHFDTAS